MEAKEANKKVSNLYKVWKRDFSNGTGRDNYYHHLEEFKEECLKLHSVVGLYEALTDKNALRMASICSTIRFTEPFRMLLELQKRLES